MIASGPAAADATTCADAIRIAEKYRLKTECGGKGLPWPGDAGGTAELENHVIGSVGNSAGRRRKSVRNLTTRRSFSRISWTAAREAGAFLGSIALSHAGRAAFICGGETVVRLTGSGKGGRNQELALAAAEKIDGLQVWRYFLWVPTAPTAPTDAAGGYGGWGNGEKKLREKGRRHLRCAGE